MVVYSKADDLQKKYANVHPDDDNEAVEFVIGQYADGWDALAKQLEDQHEVLNCNADTKLSDRNRKDLEAKPGTRSDEGIIIIKMIHGLLVADMTFDSMPKDQIKDETLFGVVQIECRDSQVHVSMVGIEHNILEMKQRLYEKCRWVWDIEEHEVGGTRG